MNLKMENRTNRNRFVEIEQQIEHWNRNLTTNRTLKSNNTEIEIEIDFCLLNTEIDEQIHQELDFVSWNRNRNRFLFVDTEIDEEIHQEIDFVCWNRTTNRSLNRRRNRTRESNKKSNLIAMLEGCAAWRMRCCSWRMQVWNDLELGLCLIRLEVFKS